MSDAAFQVRVGSLVTSSIHPSTNTEHLLVLSPVHGTGDA